ncbi:aa3-type cytochrome oxidase subunit IV [Naasia lichenicola]|uniref:Cytochrome c oxidase polypeptide 4 n=1 Tax=Naasia lichenicola TaxID=2565933 RepID=A0A4S4FTD5_9MICO|nr:cytochrome c oxidase subunit 4 [Naasia lichenicola]THG33015.1 cytochrome c oxidase subunit 4 [Naasia lichenicola]
MRGNIRILLVIAAWAVLVCVVYVVWNLIDVHEIEWAGTTALALTAIFAGFVAFYLRRAHRAQGVELPEDRLDADIDDGDPELGTFSPGSWWPPMLGLAAFFGFLGMAVGVWITFFAVGLFAIAIVGWTYEYYRGSNAH